MKLVALDKLIPYANNARTHSPEQINKLRSSIREFGFINPIIIDRDFGVIAGHGRISAAREEGITELPCVFADHLTEAQKKAYIIADNRMALDAGWDEELLRVEIESLSEMAFDLSFTGFDADELSKLFDGDNEIKDDDFDVDAELQKPTITKPGDVWLLGRHRLVCGDSTKSETFTALMDGKLANLVVTDPPYNVNYEGTAGKIKNDNMGNEAFYDFLLAAFKNTEAAITGCFYLCISRHTEGLNFRAFSDDFQLSGAASGKSRHWCSGAHAMAARACFVRLEEKSKHKCTQTASKQPYGSLISQNAEHPTAKPHCFAGISIMNSSLANCIILDPFGGSGSTLGLRTVQQDMLYYRA